MYSVQYITAAHVLCCSLLQVSRRGTWQECPTFHWAHKLPKHKQQKLWSACLCCQWGSDPEIYVFRHSLFKQHFGTTGKLWAVILYCLLNLAHSLAKLQEMVHKWSQLQLIMTVTILRSSAASTNLAYNQSYRGVLPLLMSTMQCPFPNGMQHEGCSSCLAAAVRHTVQDQAVLQLCFIKHPVHHDCRKLWMQNQADIGTTLCYAKQDVVVMSAWFCIALHSMWDLHQNRVGRIKSLSTTV